MSILKPEFLSVAQGVSGAEFAVPETPDTDTARIARLANALYRGTDAASPGDAVPLPEGASVADAWLPDATGKEPQQAPSQGVAAPDNTLALAGGFPETTSSSSVPPVHPSVVAAEPVGEGDGAPAAVAPSDAAVLPPRAGESVPSGTLRQNDRHGHEFGEPYFYTDPHLAQSRAGAAPVVPVASGRELGDAGDYYFLQQGLPAAESPALAGYGGRASPLWANPLGENPSAGFDIQAVRKDFPALHQTVNGKPLVWLDNAATTHKPQAVIDATSRFYERDNSNIHRAAHALAARSTDLFEAGRQSVRRFLGAGDAKEIVFVRGTTEAINLVAQSYGRSHIGKGDEILLTQLEHHANIVPWQILASQTGAVLRVIPINDRGELIVEKIPQLITSRTKIVSVAHVSNSLGTVNPVREIIALAHSRGVPVLVDGAQSTPHMPINVQELDADFYVFSGHKVFGPTGIGALYAKRHWLEALPAWQGGGHMIKDVTFEKTVFNAAPEKFEAGTPDIAGVVGLGAAIEYLFRIGIPALAAYEHSLLEYATDALRSVPGLRPIGTAANKASVLSFVIPGRDNAEIARYLDGQGIAVRAGHHCAQPAIRHFGLESSVRPSLAFYNTFAEVDALVRALQELTRR